jgi:O-antigen/teichoic acid export membrane protein
MTSPATDRSSIAILGIGRIIQLATVFLSFRILTTALPTNEIGYYFLLQSLMGFFGLIVVNPIGTFINREIHGWEKAKQLRSALARFVAFGFGTSVLAALVASLVGVLNISSIGTHESLLQSALAIAVMVAGATFANTFIPVLNILEKRKAFVLFSVVSQLLALGVSYFVVLNIETSASAWWITTGLIQILLGLVCYRLLVKAETSHALTDSALHAQAWSFAAPIAVANVAVWGLMQGYRPFVETFSGLDALAKVGLGLGIAASVTAAFETLVMQIFLPRFYRESHSTDPLQREHNWNRLWRVSLPSYLALTIALSVLAPQFLSILSGDAFLDAAPYLAIGAFAELARMSGNLLVLNAQSNRNMNPTRLPYWVGAIAALLGSFFAIRTNNMETVAWSLVTGQLIATLLLARSLTNVKMFRLSFSSIVRFTAIPLLVGWLVRDFSSILAIAVACLLIGVLTLHYWWQESRT